MPASDSANRVCSVGAELRENRESRGISLEEASRVTRIGKNYLTALEGDYFEVLPNPAYVKGFLRAYAAFLGLSGDELVARYEGGISAGSPALGQEEEHGKAGAPDAVEVIPPRGSRWGVPLVLLAFVLVAAFFIEDREGRSVKPPVTSPPPPQRGAVPALPPRSSAQIHPGTPQPPVEKGKDVVRPTDAETQGDGIVLKIKVNQDCWLNIAIDETVSQQYDLKAGDLIEWKGERVFVLDIGNAGGIEAEFNGKPLSSFGQLGKPVHVVLKANGPVP